jgi:glycosyltransferase involved in cell wall biosynthesis
MNSNRTPVLTIITASYNSAATIEKTILSVINQTYPNLEYIIIDGASNDGTVEIIKKYESKISYWISEPDKGISDAWNKGLAKATGEIIGLINSDDWYAENAINLAVTTLLNNPRAGFVFGDLLFVGKNGLPEYRQKGDSDYKSTIAFRLPSIPHPTVFVRQAVYRNNGYFNIDYHSCMDYEFFLRLTKSGVLGFYIPEVMAFMRLGGESDRNYWRNYHEGMKASIYYGYNPLLATIRFNAITVKTFIKKLFQQLKLDFLVRLYRIYIGKRYQYDVDKNE